MNTFRRWMYGCVLIIMLSACSGQHGTVSMGGGSETWSSSLLYTVTDEGIQLTGTLEYVGEEPLTLIEYDINSVPTNNRFLENVTSVKDGQRIFPLPSGLGVEKPLSPERLKEKATDVTIEVYWETADSHHRETIRYDSIGVSAES